VVLDGALGGAERLCDLAARAGAHGTNAARLGSRTFSTVLWIGVPVIAGWIAYYRRKFGDYGLLR
jgi:hypothetical protein